MVAPYAWPRSYKVSRLWNRRAHTSGAGKYLRTLVSIATGAKLIDETCLEETRSLPSLDAWLLSRPCLIGRLLLTFSRFVTPDVEERKSKRIVASYSVTRLVLPNTGGTHPRRSIQSCEPKPDPSVARGCRVDATVFKSQSPGRSCTLDLLRWQWGNTVR